MEPSEYNYHNSNNVKLMKIATTNGALVFTEAGFKS